MEIEGINKEAFYEQRREQILKGNYALSEVIIPNTGDETEDSIPSCNMRLKNVNMEQVAKLYIALKGQLKYMEEKYPLACLIAKTAYSIENMGSFEINCKENDED